MACAVDNSDKKIAEILQANNTIKKSISAIIQEYLDLQNRFFDKVGSVIQNLETVQSVANIFLTDEQKTFLKEFKPIEGVQLAICGYNSAGKTTFVHELLACGNFLPTGIGAVSARIIKFSYAPANEACLIKYQSQLDPNEPEEIVELSSHFVGPKSKANTKLLKETIKKHVARPEIDCMSDEFEKWASHLIEIRIPSRFLQYGIDVYDTPGFLGNDPPILAENLLKLVSSVRPSLVYLYDNPVVSDDSRKCFEQLQLALRHHFRGTAIFFLNTKADVLTIRKDADDDDDDENDNLKKNECEDRLLNSERKQRYNLLLKVNEMNSAILGGKHLPIDQCDCFDIFSSQGSTDSMEIKMKTHAINSIVCFAAEHDLHSTKQIISIVLGTIDDFFDFVLITNRRSPTEWTTMYVHTYQWIDEYFATYQSHIDEIANEAKILLPIKFSQHCEDIEKRAIPHCVTTWWERIYASSLSRDSIGFLSSSAVIDYINMAVEKEVITPVLHEITSKISKNAKEQIDRTKKPTQSTKNELLMAAYRTVMMNSEGEEYGSFYTQSSFRIGTVIGLLVASPVILINGSLNYGLRKYLSFLNKKSRSGVDSRIHKIEEKRKADVREHLLDLKENLREIDKQIKENMQKWLEKNRADFRRKVDDYFLLVRETLEQRQVAYKLAREFAPLFARIECSLVANLDLANHHGLPLTIQRDTVLGTGGFFTIYPAIWGSEQNLVVKELKDPIADQDIACLEAHFHRTVTRLQIPHMVPLEYLYETVKDPRQFVIVLRRYPKSLHSHLMTHMQEISIDKALQISLDISRAIALMHSYELVHRDVKAQNILLDANDQVYLADFGTCQHGTENSTFIGSRPFVPELTTGDHQYSYQGSAFDVFCLGILMYVVAPKDVFHQPRTLAETDVNSLDRNRVPDSYSRLILRCINTEPILRPKANEVVEELERIINTIAYSKPCLVCLDAPRTIRCLPCQHKTMCTTCLAAAQQASEEPQCIICRDIFTSVEEDADPNTFIVARTPTTVIQ